MDMLVTLCTSLTGEEVHIIELLETVPNRIKEVPITCGNDLFGLFNIFTYLLLFNFIFNVSILLYILNEPYILFTTFLLISLQN